MQSSSFNDQSNCLDLIIKYFLKRSDSNNKPTTFSSNWIFSMNLLIQNENHPTWIRLPIIASNNQTVFAFDVTKLLAPNVEWPFFWFNDFNNYFFLFWSKFLFSVIFWRNLKPKSAWLNRMISVSTLCKKIIENRPLEFWHRLLSIENG